MAANPVHRGYLADPFVIPWDGSYLAYGTGSAPSGRPFEILRSRDLVHWESLGGALEPLVDEPWATDYWAPEIVRGDDGVWRMYYSVGTGDEAHVLRVASADTPLGPFADRGVVLTPGERFAIDPHPFRDADGRWYLYFARDVMDCDRPGTSLAAAPLDTGMEALTAEPVSVLMASRDWQIFQRGRTRYGITCDWHTLEGPFVVCRDGRYWLLYSGGCWERENYGVGFAVADAPLGPFTEPRPGPVVLAGVVRASAGAGHCSVFVGLDGHERIAYHAWDAARERRQLCIDRLAWRDDGPLAAR